MKSVEVTCIIRTQKKKKSFMTEMKMMKPTTFVVRLPYDVTFVSTDTASVFKPTVNMNDGGVLHSSNHSIRGLQYQQ